MSYLKRVEKERERNRAIEEKRKAQKIAARDQCGESGPDGTGGPAGVCLSGLSTDDRYKSRASRAAAARDLEVAKATGKLPPRMASALLAASMAAQRELGPLKLLAILTLTLGLAGCDAITDPPQHSYWMIEREGRPALEIQRDFDAMGLNGWAAQYDDDLEKSGYYVYFLNVSPKSQTEALLRKTKADLDAGRVVGK